MINPFNFIPSLVLSAPKEEKLDLSINVERIVRREGDKTTYTYKVNGREVPRWEYCKELWDGRRYSGWKGWIPPECRGRRKKQQKKKQEKPAKVGLKPDNLQRMRDSIRKRGVDLPQDKTPASKPDKRSRSDKALDFIKENWLAGIVWAVAIGALGVAWWLWRRGRGGDDGKKPPKDNMPPPPPPPAPPQSTPAVAPPMGKLFARPPQFKSQPPPVDAFENQPPPSNASENQPPPDKVQEKINGVMESLDMLGEVLGITRSTSRSPDELTDADRELMKNAVGLFSVCREGGISFANSTSGRDIVSIDGFRLTEDNRLYGASVTSVEKQEKVIPLLYYILQNKLRKVIYEGDLERNVEEVLADVPGRLSESYDHELIEKLFAPELLAASLGYFWQRWLEVDEDNISIEVFQRHRDEMLEVMKLFANENNERSGAEINEKAYKIFDTRAGLNRGILAKIDFDEFRNMVDETISEGLNSLKRGTSGAVVKDKLQDKLMSYVNNDLRALAMLHHFIGLVQVTDMRQKDFEHLAAFYSLAAAELKYRAVACEEDAGERLRGLDEARRHSSYAREVFERHFRINTEVFHYIHPLNHADNARELDAKINASIEACVKQRIQKPIGTMVRGYGPTAASFVSYSSKLYLVPHTSFRV